MSVAVSVRWDVDAPRPANATRRALSSLIRRAVRAVLAEESVADGEISVALVGDETMAAINAQWIGHEGPTDVISFPLYEGAEPPVGDIYVGVAQAERQADRLGVDVAEEIARLAIHGTLHVLGHDHPTGEARTAAPMWRIQERLVREVMRT